jgi:hypothetical protein
VSVEVQRVRAEYMDNGEGKKIKNTVPIFQFLKWKGKNIMKLYGVTSLSSQNGLEYCEALKPTLLYASESLDSKTDDARPFEVRSSWLQTLTLPHLKSIRANELRLRILHVRQRLGFLAEFTT